MYGNKRRSQNEKLNFLFEYIFKKNIEFPNFVQLKRIKIATEVAIDKYIYIYGLPTLFDRGFGSGRKFSLLNKSTIIINQLCDAD